jgi:hypothetical protein
LEGERQSLCLGLNSFVCSFKVIFAMVLGNDWKAGACGNMDVDKQDKMDNRFAFAITLGHVKNHH